MVNERFIMLLTKELSDELTQPEREELHLILQGSKAYRDQREILKNFWETDRVKYEANTAMFRKVMDKIKVKESLLPVPQQEEPIEKATQRKLFPAIWYSAAAVLITISFIAYYANKTIQPLEQTVAVKWLQKSTPATKKLVLMLADSTIVTMNSGTTLKYPDHFSETNREVYLNGEAFFDVTKDKHHPFIIHTKKMNVRVLGTSFNVKSYSTESLSETTLIKGSIEVTLNDRPADRIILKPKEKLIVQDKSAAIKKQNNLLSKTSPIDTAAKGTKYALTNLTYLPNDDKMDIETSWVENKLAFRDRNFDQISAQFERWYGVHIEFKTDRIKEYRFTAGFTKETLPQALDALKMAEHFNYKIVDSTVYIY